VLTKPKVKPHLLRCQYATFSCVDCGTHFPDDSVHQHTACISEAHRWHGKFAKTKKGNGTKIKETSQSTTTPPPTPQPTDKLCESTSSSTKKRKVEESDGEAIPRKRQKIEPSSSLLLVPTTPDCSTFFNLEDFKWKRTTKKFLKKAEGKTVEREALKQMVVDELLKEIRQKAEEIFDRKLQCNSKVIVKNNKASFR